MASSDKHIHLISFDVPFPPSYGGVIDVFYKLKALSENNVRVTLHCFRYGRPESSELSRYCDQVIYYPRKSFVSFFTDGKPWIVSSRMSEALVQNLLRDHDPILFEGLHTCGILNDPRLRNRKRIVRTHNIEHDYYHNLAEAERSVLKKLYFREESRRLKKFEMELASATAVAAISPSDQNHFTSIQPNTFYLPAFHPNDALNISTGTGSFALYHGNLGVGENDKAALYLVNEVFRDSDIPLVIAGSNPTEALSSAVQQRQNIKLIRDIPTEEVMQLVRDAQVHVLPTFQPTGIKLKLLAALFNGRHLVVNREMVENTGLEPLCHVAADAETMRAIAGKLMQKEFGKEEYTQREKILNSAFSNHAGAGILIEKMFA